MFRSCHAVFEQALPPQTRTVQVCSDARAPQTDSLSCIGTAASAGSLSGAARLLQPGRALCWELEPAERCLTVREVSCWRHCSMICKHILSAMWLHRVTSKHKSVEAACSKLLRSGHRRSRLAAGSMPVAVCIRLTPRGLLILPPGCADSRSILTRRVSDHTVRWHRPTPARLPLQPSRDDRADPVLACILLARCDATPHKVAVLAWCLWCGQPATQNPMLMSLLHVSAALWHQSTCICAKVQPHHRRPCLCNAGPVTAMTICQSTLCLACQSTETPLVTIPVSDLASARTTPLRESKTVRQWVSGLLGTSQPPQIACLATVPLWPNDSASTAASPHSLLAVLYTNGLLSVWEAASGRHLCQMIVGSGADGRHADSGAQPVTVSGLCDSAAFSGSLHPLQQGSVHPLQQGSLHPLQQPMATLTILGMPCCHMHFSV